MNRFRPSEQQSKILSDEALKLANRCMEITFTTPHDVEFQYSAHVNSVQITVMHGGYHEEMKNAERHYRHLELECVLSESGLEDGYMTETLAWFTEMHLKLDELPQEAA